MTGSRVRGRVDKPGVRIDLRSTPDAGFSLLITSFGRFDGGANCSEALLDRLSSERAEIEALWGDPVTFARLDVDTASAERNLRLALCCRPTHVLLMGQAAGRAQLSFERTARNLRNFRVPDARGRSGELGPVRSGGPDRLPATWPDLQGAARALSDGGVPASVSEDAGAHLCNQTLYLALEAGVRAEPPFVAAFLHLPLTPEQVADGVPAAARFQNCFALPLDDMARAVRLFLVHTRRVEDQRRRAAR